MKDILSLQAELQERDNPKPHEFKAVMGRADGMVKVNAEYVYVTLYNGDVIEVFNDRVPRVAYRKIIIGYDDRNPSLFQVLRFDNVYASNPHPNLPNHKESHAWFSYDPIDVFAEQFMPLLPRAIGSMVVRVYGGWYRIGDVFHFLPTRDVDMTAELPASGAEWVSAEIDSAGVITFAHGTNKASREILLPEDIDAPDASKKLLYSAKMYKGLVDFIQTRIDTDIFDPRFSGSAAGGGYTPPTTTALNDVQVGDGAGAWIKKTLAEFVTILRTTLDSVYQAAGAYLTEAPIDGTPYARQDAGWIAASNGTSVETEIDFGTANIIEKTFIITDANVSVLSEINVYVKGKDTSDGRSKDETTSEFFQFSCVAGAGTFDLKVVSLNGTVNGKFVLGYFVG